MLKVGITGGIGSGKSTVSKIFETLGVPVYYADDAAKKIMNENAELRQQIMALFGEAIYTNNILNRKVLADIVFNDPDKLEQLNAIVHPATINDANAWLMKQTTPYAIKEAALIFESSSHQLLDYVIGVHAPAPLRIQRIMARDNATREEVLARMSKQMDEAEKMNLCNFVLYNDEQQLLTPQVVALHQHLLALANETD
jgi:dephospho-CoA kinase